MTNVTQILSKLEQGDQKAADELLPLVYNELRKLATQRLRHEEPGHTLQSTALVHEAYVRLIGTENPPTWNSRGHFFGAAAEAMRRILIENARRKQRVRHGGEQQRVPFDSLELPGAEKNIDLLALDEALNRLAGDQPNVAELVKLRYFAGLTIEQTAEALQISVRTANRHWVYAKAWLFQRLSS